jgi:signal transduction histidine kinase
MKLSSSAGAEEWRMVTGRLPTDRIEVPENTRLEQLVLAGLALTSEASLDGVLHRVVAIAAEVIGARYTAIGVLAPDGRLLERFITHGISDAERDAMGPPPAGHGILGLILREGRPIRLPDLVRHPDSCGFPPHHPPMHSFLGVPITGRRGVVGNLYLTEKLGGAQFTDDDEHVAILLAAMTAAAVENARLHEESAQLLAEVHQLHRARERFFAMVNHELRNALAAVYGWSELLVRRKTRETAPPAAFEVLDAAQQAVDLISDLLDLSRLDEDRLRPVVRQVEAGGLAHRAAGRATPTAHAKKIRIEIELAHGLPTIETDASRVEQILMNLLTNAIKYSPAGTGIQLSVRVEGDVVRYQVEDEGPGIRAEEQERIFDVYVTTAEGEKQGVGLGLPLSRRLARLLGGDLRALPRAGAGIFHLDLPIGRGTS